MARLKPTDWLEAEELYRQGWTQKQIAQKFDVRVETVSKHMTAKKIQGGEHIDVVRQEVAMATSRKQRDWAEKRAQRTIEAKDKFLTLTSTLVAMFVRELKEAQENRRSLAAIAPASKALREALSGIALAREEQYKILNIVDETEGEDIPDLVTRSMTAEEEEELRAARAPASSDEEDLADLENALDEDGS